MKEYWEENLHALNREGLIERLSKISTVFNSLPIPDIYNEDQLYFVVQDDYEAVKIGLSKRPLEKFASLQIHMPKKLILLFYYDPMEQKKKFEEALPDVKIHPRYQNPIDVKEQQIRWLRGDMEIRGESGWSYPDNRALQILIKKGMIYLKEIMTELGLDYRKA
ncbi:MAG: hypothetical protein ABII26_01140 [Pseudomonadota bacterium]